MKCNIVLHVKAFYIVFVVEQKKKKTNLNINAKYGCQMYL